MDINEKKILRRKVYLLKEKIDWTRNFYRLCKKQTLLNDEQILALRKIQDDKQRTEQFILFLEDHPSQHTFDKICFLLEKHGRAEVGDELFSERMAELGKLPATEDVKHEADLLVRRLEKPGGPLIQQGLRRGIQILLAERVMVLREAYKRRIIRDMKVLNEQRRAVQRDVEDVNVELYRFLCDKTGLGARYTDMEEDTSDDDNARTTSKSGPWHGGLTTLRARVATIQEIVQKLLNEQEELLDERRSCFTMLGISPEIQRWCVGGKSKMTYPRRLDIELAEHIASAETEIGKIRAEAWTRQNVMDHIEKQMRDMRLGAERKMTLKNQELEKMRATIKDNIASVEKIEEDMAFQKRQQEITEAKLQYWMKRSVLLERTRRFDCFEQAINVSDDRFGKQATFDRLTEVIGTEDDQQPFETNTNGRDSGMGTTTTTPSPDPLTIISKSSPSLRHTKSTRGTTPVLKSYSEPSVIYPAKWHSKEHNVTMTSMASLRRLTRCGSAKCSSGGKSGRVGSGNSIASSSRRYTGTPMSFDSGYGH